MRLQKGGWSPGDRSTHTSDQCGADHCEVCGQLLAVTKTVAREVRVHRPAAAGHSPDSKVEGINPRFATAVVGNTPDGALLCPQVVLSNGTREATGTPSSLLTVTCFVGKWQRGGAGDRSKIIVGSRFGSPDSG